MVDNKVEVKPKLTLEQKKVLLERSKVPLERDKAVYERLERQIENEEEIMAEESGLVTRAELMKRDMNEMKKELEAKIAAGREADLETKGKVQQLDGKVCKGEECYARIERKQDEMFKVLEEKFKSLSEPKFICRKCHASSIRKGDKACSVCGDAVDVVWN